MNDVFWVFLFDCWPYLPQIQTWPTFKVIVSRYLSATIFLALSFTSPSTLYICLIVSAQNSHTVHTPYPTYQKHCYSINYALNHY